MTSACLVEHETRCSSSLGLLKAENGSTYGLNLAQMRSYVEVNGADGFRRSQSIGSIE